MQGTLFMSVMVMENMTCLPNKENGNIQNVYQGVSLFEESLRGLDESTKKQSQRAQRAPISLPEPLSELPHPQTPQKIRTPNSE